MIILPLGEFMMGGPVGDSTNRLVVFDGKLTMVEVGYPRLIPMNAMYHAEIAILIVTNAMQTRIIGGVYS
jgi:hypothetical protein